MAGSPPIGPVAGEITTTAVDARVAIDVDAVETRLLNETRRLLSDLGQLPLTSEELANRVEQGLLALSDTLIEQAGRGATSEAFNLGRNEAIQQPNLLGLVTEVVRTEILDQNTCPQCLPIEQGGLDGLVVKVNSPEYFEFMPPNYCDGGDFCRGFYLYRIGA